MPELNRIIEIKFGSHLYGCDTPNSDLDLKGIYLPTAKEIVLGNHKRTINKSRPKAEFERNNKDDVDIEMFSLDQFLKLLLEGQTMALDMLFSPSGMWTYKNDTTIHLFQDLKLNREKLLNRKLNAFVGYARQQASKYGQKGFRVHAYRATLDMLKSHPNELERISVLGLDRIASWIMETKNANIKLVELGIEGRMLMHIDVCGKYIPLTTTFKHTKHWLQKYFDEYGQRALMAERNEGVDWKALSHAVRVNCEASELLRTSQITFPRPERELLLQIKTGQVPYKRVAEIIENGLEELQAAEQQSILADAPDYIWANNWLYDVYSHIVRES